MTWRKVQEEKRNLLGQELSHPHPVLFNPHLMAISLCPEILEAEDILM